MPRIVLALTALTVFVSVLATKPALAHVKTSDGRWLFTGSTYRSDQDRTHPPNRTYRSDPISVIWRGPSGTDATVRRAQIHTEEHWRERRIPSNYPGGARMRVRNLNPFCRKAQYVFNRRGNSPNDGRWSSSVGYMSTNGACARQYHIRMFNSNVHGSDDFFGADHRNEWVLAPIHHERVVLRCGFARTTGICRPDHKVDMSWDQARYIYYRTMKPEHCVDPKWAVHPESQRFTYGDYEYTGLISRISFRHHADAKC